METTTSTTKQSIAVTHLLNKFRKDIEKQLQYLVNMAKRLKLTPPTWEFSEVYEYEFTIETELGRFENIHGEMDNEVEAEHHIEQVFDITINIDETLKLDGEWVFACAINHREKGMIQVDDNIEIPIRYSPSNDTCEHCGKKYPRVKSYIVHNQLTNEFKQVGKGCLKQFLGINPASYVTMFEAISHFSPIVQGFGRKNAGGRMDNLAYNVDEMLRYTIHQVAKDGEFVKTQWEDKQMGEDWRGQPKYRKSIANEDKATFCKVKQRLSAISFYRMYPNLRNDTTSIAELESVLDKNKKRLDLFADVDFDDKKNPNVGNRFIAIKDAIEATRAHITAITYKQLLDENILPYEEDIAQMRAFVDKLVVEYADITDFDNPTSSKVIKSGFDGYKEKLKTVFLKERTLQTNLGTIVSGWGFFLKQRVRDEAEKLRLANAQNLNFVGEIGQKSELVLKITGVKTGNGQYGTWQLWTMEDENGNKFKKFGQISEKHIIQEAPDKQNDGNSGVAEGDTIQVLAEIKKHEEYRGEKQTTLGRMSKSKIKGVKYLNKSN